LDRNSSDGGDQLQSRVLSDEKRDLLHEASVKILETIGGMVRRPDAVEMMLDADCEADGDIVRAPRRLLEDALDSALK
jgi:trimethylamine--corrinoid protein Co-methyltransferase